MAPLARGQNARLGADRGRKRAYLLDLYRTILELIDLRSFSNLWYWIALAVTWSSVSHWVLGVPYDMIARARRDQGQAELDLNDISRVNVNRLLYITQVSGIWILGFACFALTGLVILGFWYNVEFAQAVFLLAFPMSMVFLLNLFTARLIDREAAEGELLYKRLSRLRLYTQMIGMVSIFVTALWGMLQNLLIGALG